MRLSLIEQKLHDVDSGLERSRQRHAVRRWRAVRGLSDSKGHAIAYRNDLSDRRLAIENGDGFASPNGTEVLAQSGLEFRDSNLLHSHIMTRNSHHEQTGPAGKCRSYCRPARILA